MKLLPEDWKPWADAQLDDSSQPKLFTSPSGNFLAFAFRIFARRMDHGPTTPLLDEIPPGTL